MKLFYRLKIAVRKQLLSIEEFFKAYKDSKKFHSTFISFIEYENIVLSMSPKESNDSIWDSWEVFDHTSDERIDYWHFIERVNTAVGADAKSLKNAWNFNTMPEIFENICQSCRDNPWFALGSLLKDFDYLNNGTVGEEQLWKIITSGCPGLTSGDIDYFIQTLKKEHYGDLKS